MNKLTSLGYVVGAVLLLAGWWAALDWTIQSLRDDIKRIDCRQDNFVQALDNVYNMLQEHMRGIKDDQKNIPWKFKKCER